MYGVQLESHENRHKTHISTREPAETKPSSGLPTRPPSQILKLWIITQRELFGKVTDERNSTHGVLHQRCVVPTFRSFSHSWGLLVSFSLCGLLVEFWCCLKRREMCTFGVLRLSCETLAASKANGVSHDSLRTQTLGGLAEGRSRERGSGGGGSGAGGPGHRTPHHTPHTHFVGHDMSPSRRVANVIVPPALQPAACEAGWKDQRRDGARFCVAKSMP